MGQSFGEFVEQIEQSRDSSGAFDIWLESLKGLGMNYAILGYMVPGRAPTPDQYFATNYSADWLTHYAEHNYAQLDIPFLLAEQGSGPFTWDSALKRHSLTSAQRRIYHEAAETGLKTGISSCLAPSPGVGAVYSVATDEPDADCDHMLSEVHARTAVLHRAFMGHLSVEMAPAQPLTPREQEVLTQWARGKTAWEISRLLGVSQETVKFHLKNCYTKLGAYGRIAIVKALYLGLISIDPDDISFTTTH